MKKLLICLTVIASYASTYTGDTSKKDSFLQDLLDTIKSFSASRKDKAYDHENSIDFYNVTQPLSSEPIHGVDSNNVQQENPHTNASPAAQEIDETENSNTDDQIKESHTPTPREKSYLKYAPLTITITAAVIVGAIVYRYKTSIIDNIVSLKNKMMSYFC